jgi:hypothetical protein
MSERDRMDFYDLNLISPLGGMKQRHSRSISNVFSGMFNDIPVMVMDYKYTTGGGKSSHTWQQTVLTFESDKLLLPSFFLRPENLFDKIGG